MLLTITIKMETGHVPLVYTHVKHVQTLLLVLIVKMMPVTYMKELVLPFAQMVILKMMIP